MAIEFAQVGAFQGIVGGPDVLFNPTSVQFGPDGRLYVSEQSGSIHVFEIDVQNGEYVAVSEELVVDASGAEIIRSIQNHDDDGAINDAVTDRQVTGILVAGTAANPVIYVTSSDPRINSDEDGRADTNLDTNSGILSRVTWTGSEWEVVDLIRGLPRSEENHSNNAILMSEDGTKLYTAVGGNTNQGAPSTFFSYTAEYALSGALLEIDLVALNAMPVLTDNGPGQNGRQYVYDLPTLDDPNTANVTDGSGEDAGGMDEAGPWGGRDGLNQTILPADAPMRIYADGFRNNYDLVQTATGQMYTVDNGGNLDLGGPPVFVNGLPTNEIDNGGAGDPEPLYHVVDGGYYGHPAPVRANPTLQWVVLDDDGNPDASLAVNTVADVSTLVPDAVNIQDGFLIDPSKFTGDAARLAQSGVYVSPTDPNSESLANIGSSSNGLVEYTGSAFDGALQGALLVAQFNGNITVLNVNADGSGLDPVIDPGPDGVLGTGDDVVLSQSGIYSVVTGLATPLDVTMGPAGTIWVAEIGGSAVKVFTPSDIAVDDEDADNDGILDIDDPFSRDPTNGGAVQVTPGVNLLWDFDPNQDGNLPGPSGYGGGLTGAMINGVIDYEDYYQEPADFPGQIIRLDNMKFLTAAGGGTIVIENVSTGDPLNASNSGEYLFHTGVTIAPTVETFTITWTVVNPTSTLTGPEQQIGGYIGTGDQSNYLKFAAIQSPLGQIALTLEDGDLSTTTFLQAPGIFSAPLDSAIVLELVVDPAAQTATPTATWSTASGPQSVSGSAISLAGTGVLDAINGDVTVNGQTTGLAVGLFASNTGQTDATTFQAIFDGIAISATGAPVTESVLYRVNAAGDLVAATDGGPDWSADTVAANSPFLASAGSNTTAGFAVAPGGTVPAEVPAAIFQSERYDTAGGAAMQWAFDTPQAGFYEVRLYVGNGYDGTAAPGQRVFDVAVEGAVPAAFGAIDLSATFGDLVGGMLSTQVEVTDGVLNLEFIHGVENPLINGIEIIQLDPGGALPAVSVASAQAVGEAAGFTQFSFTTSATVPIGETVTVFFQITPTTATGEVDFTIDPSIATFNAQTGIYTGSLVFASGSSDASIPVTIINDDAFEGDEAFTALITGVSANATIGTASATVTITDDDPSPADVTPPTAVIAPIADVTDAAAAIVVSVTYADETALDATSIGVTDLTLSGPGLATPLAPASASFEPTTGVATYSFTAPAGGWQDGAFTVDLLAAEVADTSGNTAAAAQAAVTVNTTGADVTPPTAVIAPIADVTDAAAAIVVSVTYADETALDATSIGVTDLTLSGPGLATPLAPASASFEPTTGVATYSFSAPAGGWQDGAFTIDLLAAEVADTSGNTAAAAQAAVTVDAGGPPVGGEILAAINAGGPALSQDGIDFSADALFTGGGIFEDIDDGNGVQPVFTGTIYASERFGDFSYSIPIAATGALEIELHFAEIYWPDGVGSGIGARVFDVLLEGVTALDNIDILSATGGDINAPLVLTLNTDSTALGANGALDIAFTTEVDNAKLSGIVVRGGATTPTDVTPPTAVIAPIADVTDAAAAIVVSVTYADETALDATSIGVTDLTLSGPGLVTPLAPASASFEPTTGVATYSFTAPAGGWQDGAFTIDLLAAEVADTSGNTAAAAQAAVTVNTAPPTDVTPPTAVIAPIADVTDAAAAIVVSVTYADETALDATSIGVTDLSLSGPGLATPLAPASASFEPTTGVATYSFTAPAGGWQDGAFTIDLLAAEVADTSGNTAAAAQAAVTVNTTGADVTPPTAVIAPIADVTDAAAAIVVSVTYADETALDATSIGVTDLTLSGPGLATPLAPASASFEPTTGVATYSFAAPAGGWQDGAFTIDLLAAEVADTSGNTAAAAQAAVTVDTAPPADVTPPTAVIAPVADVTDAAAAIVISVTYADETALDATSIGMTDLTLSGPGLATPLAPASASFEPTTGVATYSFTAPAGGWQDGAFTVDLLAAEVADTAGNTAAAAQAAVTVDAGGPPVGGEILAAINAGGPALSQDGIDFSADALFTGGGIFEDIDDGNGVQPVFTGTIYASERFGDFSYSIPIAASGALEIELHFAEIYWPDGVGSGIGARVFDVLLEGVTALDNIDILAATGGDFNTPLVLTLNTDASALGANGALDIAFTTEVDNAKLSGIVVRGGATTPTDVTPPAAVIAPIADVTDAAAAIVVSVTYADETALDATSIGVTDLTLSGPGLVTPLAPASASFEPTTGVATYSFTAPAGGWQDGAFTVDLLAAEVADTSGNTVAAAQAAVIVNTAPPTDVTPPTAVIAPVADVTDAAAAIVVSVTYTDETALDATSIGVTDLTLSGPGLATPLAPASASFEPTTGVATYSFTAPAGGWQDGAFTVDLLAAEVADTSGNTAAAAQAAVTVNTTGADVTPPTAVIAPIADVTDAAAAIVVSVTYADETALDATSIGVTDLTLSGPGLATPLAPASASFEPTTGVATYSFTAPAGGWQDGAFNVDLLAAEVADTAGNTAAAAQAAVTVNTAPSADVTPPTAVIAPVADVTDAAAAIVVSVTYADETALDATSIGVSDLTLSGPGLATPLAPASASFEPTTGVATYSFTAPAGGWQDGAFTIDLLAAEVADTSGNTAAAAQAAVTVDAGGPPVGGEILAAINAGGPALSQDGIDFSADALFTGGGIFEDIDDGNGVQPVFTGTIYASERFGDFSYSIPIAASGALEIELHFAEIYWPDGVGSGIGARVFDVLLEGVTALDNIDILAATGGDFNTPLVLTLNTDASALGANGALDIAFTTEVDNAKLSGIVVRGGATTPTDVTPPAAVIAPIADVTDAAAAIVVSVTYTDETALDATSIGVTDLTLSGPGLAAPLAPASASFEPTTGVATYSFAAPAGGWQDGAFTVDLLAAEVADTSGNTAAAAQAAVTVNTAPPADVTPPTAVIAPIADVTDAAAAIVVSVTYADETALDATSVGVTDLTLSGPGLATPLAPASAGFEPTTGVATYSFTAPAGGWQDGAFTVDLLAAEVADTAGNTAAAAQAAVTVNTAPPADVTPPTAVIAPIADVTDAAAAIVVSVTYADETALDATSIGVADLTLSGPGLATPLAPASASFEPTTGVATYSFAAPAGGWQDGAFTVDLLAAEVADTSGNTAAAAQAAVTVNTTPPADVTPPTAVIAPIADVTDAAAAIVVSVTYADETALDATSIGVTDLTLSGPGLATPLAPASASFEPTTGVATYSFTAPAGGWQDGAFTIDLLAAEVADTSGNTAAAAQAAVTVNTAPPADVTPPTAVIAPIADVTDAAAAIVVSVTYADETALDATSIGVTDLTLSGPGLATPLAPASASFEPTTGVATYSFSAPAGGWQDGAFTVDLLAAEVADTAGNTAAAAQAAVTVNTAPAPSEAEAILFALPDVDSGGVYAPGAAGSAVLTILPGVSDVGESNFLANSISIANTGDKQIAAVFIDVREAVFDDSVFDIDGSAGDHLTKDFVVETDGGSGGFFAGGVGGTYFLEGVAPLANVTGTGIASSGGHRGIVIRFSGAGDGFANGETVSFSGDMDPNSVAGLLKSDIESGALNTWDVGGVSGVELGGSRFTVLFDDGTTAEGVLHSDGSQAGGVGEAVQGRAASTASVTVNGFASGEAGTYGADTPEIIVTGTPGDTVRVVLSKAFNPVVNNASGIADLVRARLAETHPDFPANNAFDVQTIDVVIGPGGSTTLAAGAFDYNTASSGVDFPASVVATAGGTITLPSSQTAPIAVSVAVIDAVTGFALGSVDRVYLTNPTATPVGATEPETVPGTDPEPPLGNVFSEPAGASLFLFAAPEEGGGAGAPGDASGPFPPGALVGTDDPDTSFGESDADDVIYALGGGDTVDALGGDDIVYGGDGADAISGGAGADELYGEAGTDVLDGGADNDLLDGGEGPDVFVFRDAFGVDTVASFEQGLDLVEIHGSSFVDAAAAVAAITQVGLDAVLEVSPGNVIVFTGEAGGGFTEDDISIL